MILLFIICVALLLCTIGISLFLGIFDTYTLIGAVIISIVYLIGYLVLLSNFNKDAEEQNHNSVSTKEKFDVRYCWNKMNSSLQNMTGGAALQWQGGINNKSTVRVYSDGTTNHSFRSFRGVLGESQTTVIVIYDIDKEIIADYDSSPIPEKLSDPFFKFEPFKKNQSDMMNRFDRRTQSRGKSLRLDVSEDNDSGHDKYGVDSSMVDTGVDFVK